MSETAFLSQLVPDVYVLNSPFAESKRSLILDIGGSTLIDTPVAFAETEMMLEKATAEGHPVRRLILTHSHFDHSAGSQLLPEAERIAWQGAADWMLSDHAANYLALRPPEHPDLVKVRTTLPTMEIAGEAEVRLEARLLRLLHTPGHSPDGLSILLEPDGVLFTGDSVVTCFPPIIQDGDSSDEVASLKRILDLDFNWLVPGHGPVLDRAAARPHIRSSLRYLESVRERIGRFDDPETSFDALMESVQDLPSVFPLPSSIVSNWHERVVRKVWLEVCQRLKQRRGP